VTIPSEINGKPVISIGDYAFQKCLSLTSLSIASSVTTLGKGAFCYCSALTSLTIPSSVTSISTYTFYGCTALTSVSIPGSISAIGDYSFYQLTSLTSLTISNGVKSIGNASFYYCSALTSLNIPSSVTYIGHHAFAYCTALTSVTIPSSVISLADHAFQQCTALTSVTIPGSINYIGDYAFQQCTALNSLTISGGVRSIGIGAFCYSSALTSATIPSSVTSIGTYAFYYCTGLTQMTFQGNAPTCGANWIGGHNANLKIYFYNGATGFTTPTWQGVSSIGLGTPSAPQIPMATAGNAQVILTWSAPASNGGSSITGYKVYRGTTSGAEALLTTLGNVLTFTNTGLTNGQTYYYKVSAVNAVGEGSLSVEVSAAPATLPTAPLNLQATLGNAQVVLTWSAPAGNGGALITAYKVYRGNSANGEAMLTTLGNVLTYADTGLLNGQTYYYKVTAVNSVGEGAQSNEASASPASVPSAPQDFQASTGIAQVVLTWSAPASNGGRPITAYDIYRNTTPGGETFFATVGSVLTYTDASVLAEQTYYYRVSAVNVIGEGPLSDEANATSILTFTLPSAPTLSSAIYGNDQVNLTWAAPISNGGESIIAYNIYCNTTSGQEELLDTVGNVLTYCDASVIDGQTYYYKISAVNVVGEGPLSNELSATTSNIPSAPLNLQATAGNAEVNLTWSAPTSSGGSSIIAYNVYCGTSSNGETMLATLSNVLTYTIGSLTNGQAYYFKVTAVNSVTEGPFSNEASATPDSVATIPSAPQDLHATAGNAQVVLTWSAPASNGGALITAYEVYSGTTPGGETLLTTVGNVLDYTAGSLTNGQVYYFKVTAVNSVGEGAQSNEASATPVTEPSAPLSLSATSGNAQAMLTWSAPASNGGTTITGYRVYRGTTSGGEALLTTLGNVLSYTNTGLTNGQSYYYKVSAVNAVGDGPQSNEASATPVTVPSAPQSFSATAGNAQVTLTWSAPASNGGTSITGYKVYRGVASGGETLLTTLGNVLSYTNTGLTNGQSYYYKVSAVNSAGEGSQSNEASATPVTVPSGPQSLSATAGNAQVVLTWSAPASDGGALITAYMVYSGTSPGGETLLTTLGNVLTYTNTGLTNGLTYYYKVTAVNSVGEGSFSNEASATPGSGATVPTAPQSLLATLGNAQVALSWSAPTNNGGSSITAYKIYRGNASNGESLLTTVGNVLSYTDTGLINGQTYYYKVTAVNSVGEGPQSNEASASPASVPSGDYIYVLINGGTAVQITGYRGLGGAVTIPSEINGKPVVSIGDYAVQKSTTITSLIIPSSVTTLGKGAFCYDTALTSVTIPNSVTSISTYTFYGCTHLTSLTIPGSIASIGDYSFYQLTSLTSLTISNGVRSIGNASFYYCSALTSVNIPSSVTSIGHHAFAYCSALTSVSIPNSVKTIADHAFQQCIALTSVTIPGSVAYIGDYAFQSCTSLTSLIISNGVTTIGVGAFCYCSALTSVTIPATVTTIGTYAFYYCTGLTQMTFQGNAPTCGANWIGGHNANLRIYYYNDATGFTNPTWNGVTTIILTR
jgi:predicted phage tail protein